VNTSEPLLGLLQARQRVLEIQTKLHRWANDDPDRRFDDLFNLVTDPSFLLMAWERVEGNKGARSAGVDGRTAGFVRERIGVEDFLAELRDQLRSRSFRPLPVRERMIPKPGSRKRRRLGIPTVADRVVQASLKLVLEPIFEAVDRGAGSVFGDHLGDRVPREWLASAGGEECVVRPAVVVG
jgi:RNA-directed DNA polymerase